MVTCIKKDASGSKSGGSNGGGSGIVISGQAYKIIMSLYNFFLMPVENEAAWIALWVPRSNSCGMSKSVLSRNCRVNQVLLELVG